MSSLKRWKQLGGGSFFKFEEVGQKLEGIWQGTQVGKFGDNGIIEVMGQPFMFSLHTALKDLLRVKPGTEVKIEYQGKRMAKNGNQFKAFGIYVEDTAQVDDPDDEVPF